jgi:hypothetical protein
MGRVVVQNDLDFHVSRVFRIQGLENLHKLRVPMMLPYPPENFSRRSIHACQEAHRAMSYVFVIALSGPGAWSIPAQRSVGRRAGMPGFPSAGFRTVSHPVRPMPRELAHRRAGLGPSSGRRGCRCMGRDVYGGRARREFWRPCPGRPHWVRGCPAVPTCSRTERERSESNQNSGVHPTSVRLLQAKPTIPARASGVMCRGAKLRQVA